MPVNRLSTARNFILAKKHHVAEGFFRSTLATASSRQRMVP
jgi:hypothetical protein